MHAALNSAGYRKEASELNSLVHNKAWITGTELLGEIGLALKNMKGKYPKDVSEDMADCLAFATDHRKILGLDH